MLFSLHFAARTGDLFCFTKRPQSGLGESKRIAHHEDGLFFLVDPGRENWNCIFVEIERLSEKLEQLGIDDFREADDV